MKEKVEKILDLMLVGLEKAGDIASTELPKLVNEYVRYFIIQDLPFISGAILCFGVVLFSWLAYKFYTSEKFRKEFADDATPLFIFGFIGLVVIPGAIFLDSAKDVLSLYYAPKAALIQKFRK